jgi:hypothetical protein
MGSPRSVPMLLSAAVPAGRSRDEQALQPLAGSSSHRCPWACVQKDPAFQAMLQRLNLKLLQAHRLSLPQPVLQNYFATTRRNGFRDFAYVRLGCVVEDQV